MMAGCVNVRQPVLCVIPFAQCDYDITLDLLVWIRELGGCRHNPCLLVAANHIKKEQQAKAIELARSAFLSVDLITPPRALPNERWPLGANWMFQTAAGHIEQHIRTPWWWNEPDCIPVREGWLEYLEEEYYRVGKPFMGCVTPETKQGDKTFLAFLNGCAMYPANTATRLNSVNWGCGEAWDILAGPICVPQSHHTPLYQYFWGEKDLAPTFAESHVKGEPRNTFTLDQLSRQAVVFHRSKDGSLIRLLRDSRRETVGRLIHVVERHRSNEARIKRAIDSWESLYNAGKMIPAHSWTYPRSSLQIGDRRGLPYLKDVLREGMNQANDHDIIVLTNGDNILHPSLPSLLHNRFLKHDCQCSFRLNIQSPPDLSLSPETLSKTGKPDYGRDLFAFRKSWLGKHWHNIPDCFLGELEWDLILAIMIRKDNGVPINSTNDFHVRDMQSELPLGYVLHELHERKWLNKYYAQSPAKLHNAQMAKEWYSRNNLRQLYTLW